jgi:hypothetical protein
LQENGKFADKEWASLLDRFENSEQFTSLESDQDKQQALYKWIEAQL